MRRLLSTLFVPEGLLVLGAAAAVRWPAVLDPARPVLPYLPLLVGALGVALAIRFRRSSVLLGLVALGAAAGASRAPTASAGVATASAVLLPVNLMALALLPERGLASSATLRRTGALSGQALLLFLLLRTGQDGLLLPMGRQGLVAPFLSPDAAVGDLAALAAYWRS